MFSARVLTGAVFCFAHISTLKCHLKFSCVQLTTKIVLAGIVWLTLVVGVFLMGLFCIHQSRKTITLRKITDIRWFNLYTGRLKI